jgi:uncharacterized membrane protein
VAGALLLIAGRRLFWLFVGLVGFFAGLRFAPLFLSGRPEHMSWLVAILFGVLGMFLAIVLQRFTVVLAGFLAGGFAAADRDQLRSPRADRGAGLRPRRHRGFDARPLALRRRSDPPLLSGGSQSDRQQSRHRLRDSRVL